MCLENEYENLEPTSIVELTRLSDATHYIDSHQDCSDKRDSHLLEAVTIFGVG